ncbi:hypothetical protein KIW84_070741 [Lathyrus oleraceus]|uniref:Uncharacterized protein n=1 Tax=Pisum sativum TaxID=3888 RepID=A0A9D4ZTZ8_PEA|nr:hypothetical protein KIW84_070741 [Pisum sativum]
MASAQCYRTCEQSCQHKNHHHQQQHSSIGQKVTDFYKGHHNDGTQYYQQQQQHSSIGHKADFYKGHHNDGTQTKTEYYSETDVIYQPGYVAKNQSNTCNQTRHNHNHAATGTTIVTGTTAEKCQGRNRRERRNMFQRIKDGISGHSSDSGSSSDECDSDNENRRHRKATVPIIINWSLRIEVGNSKSNIMCVMIAGKFE